MNSPIISIIVPVFNTPQEMLLQCIHSIQEAMCLVPSGSTEVLFVNDGSTNDYVDEVLKDLDDGFYYFKKENGGVSSARNLGIEHAVGDYLMFVDSDDWIERKALLDSLKFIRESQADIIYMGYAKNEHRIEKKQWKKFIEGEEEIRQFIVDMTAGQTEARHHNISVNSPCAKLYKKELIDSCELRFDPELSVAEDFWFNLCALASYKCRYIYQNNRLVYHYVSNKESIVRHYSDIRVRMSIVFMNRLEVYLHTYMDDSRLFEKAVCHQLLQSIQISMRTYYLHPMNHSPLLHKCRELQLYLNEPIMQRWISKLTWGNGNNYKEYRDICFLKMRFFWLLFLMKAVKRTMMSQRQCLMNIKTNKHESNRI